MPMELDRDESLRQQGWAVFRSSTRDHLIPLVDPGRILQRVKVKEAYPVVGVEVGVPAISFEERSAIADSRNSSRKVVSDGEDIALGQMQYFPCQIRNSVATANGVNTDEEFAVIVVPFDGYIKEFVANRNASDGGGQMLAIRTSSGGTLFRSHYVPRTAFPLIHNEPDFIPFDDFAVGAYAHELRGGHIPVYAGDIITAVLRSTVLSGAEGTRLYFTIGIEQYVLGRVGDRVTRSAFGLSDKQRAKAAQDAAVYASRLALEQEKTRRALAIEAQRTSRAQLEANAKLVKVQAGTQRAPTPQDLDAMLKTLQRRSPPAPAPKRAPVPPPKAVEGEGKTFVAAWNPTFGSIGYLIPDPPRGGKVNVFDGRYSVFDLTGKLVSQGPVEPIATEGDIPPGARFSNSLGTTPSPATQLSTFVPGEGFVPSQAVTGASGRASFGRRS